MFLVISRYCLHNVGCKHVLIKPIKPHLKNILFMGQMNIFNKAYLLMAEMQEHLFSHIFKKEFY